VADAIAAFRYCAGLARTSGVRESRPVAMPLDAGGLPNGTLTGSIRYEPVGVVGAICPWNYPLMMAAWKVAPALAAGCSVVLKPSEYTPLSALALVRAAVKAGLPPDVLTLVLGGGEVGAALATDPSVDKISFTGSVATGAKVSKAAADGVKRVTLELGGKSPSIICDDAHIDSALEWVAFGSWWNAGQVCSATSRVLVHESRADEVKSRLAAIASRFRLGGPFDSIAVDGSGGGEGTQWEGPDMGPIGNRTQFDKIRALLRAAASESECGPGRGGIRFLAGGPETVPTSRLTHTRYASGFFVAPTVVDGVKPGSLLWNEEVFGPVITITTFGSDDEAVRLANDSAYGLAASVYTASKERAGHFTSALRAGTVWHNCSQPVPHQLPWGGFKKSGVGREMGPHALMPFLEAKAVTCVGAGTRLGWYRGDLLA
jgi:betaine-aldehyde dehydrogenase